MSFLAPAILLSLVAMVVPILVHLIQRERKQVVEFPSLMFLRRIPYQSVRRRRIRDWALLMLRLAALLLIVLAFARPFIDRGDVTVTAASGPRELVILLDRSYSMGYENRWQRARAAARAAVRGLGPQDRAALILFATGAEAVARSSADRDALLAAIDAARLSAAATRYGPALKLGQSILVDSRLPRRELVLISDFQRAGWNRDEGVRLPDGAIVTPVSVADRATSNVSVQAVTLQRASFSGQERVTVSAALINRGEPAVTDRAVALEIDGRVLQTERVSLPGNSSSAVTFAPLTVTPPGMPATVRAAADALAADNAFHFVVSPSDRLRVLLVERGNAARDASLYLSRALGIGTAPAFDVERATADRVTPATLDDPRLVILNDVPVSSAIASRLRRFVQDGGGLLVVLGERAAWPADVADVLPGIIAAPVDRAQGRGGSLGTIDYSHPVFELFKTPRSGDFSAARFFRYRAVTVAPPATVLARFDDGAVALAERRLGQGRVLLWASTLDTFWNDLAVKPVYLPFVHRLGRHLASYTEQTSWSTIGQAIDVSPTSGSRAASPLIVLTPSGQRVELAADRGSAVELSEQGFYEVRTGTAAQGKDAPPRVVAANVDAAKESDLTAFDPRELAGAVSGRAAANAAGAAAETRLSPEEQERRQSTWWYLLFAGSVLLGIETLLANRLSRPEPA